MIITVPEMIELTEAVCDDLVPLPADAPDVCPQCRSSKDPDPRWTMCTSCGRVERAIGNPCPFIIPISFYSKPSDGQPLSPMRERMHDYKEHEDPAVRAADGDVVAGILVRYFFEHEDAMRETLGDWDVVTAIPSKKHDGPSALEVALEPYSELLPTVTLLESGPGAINRAPNPDAFNVIAEVGGLRVVLVDDTFTMGATIQSAAHALVEAGAVVLFGVVVARKINPNPDYPHSVDVWERQKRIPFHFTSKPFWVS